MRSPRELSRRGASDPARHRPVDCDCPLGVSRFEPWRPTALALTPTAVLTSAVALPVTGSLAAGVVLTAGASAVAVLGVALAMRLPRDVRRRVAVRRFHSPTDPSRCRSREHASVAVRVRRSTEKARWLTPSWSLSKADQRYAEVSRAVDGLTHVLDRLSRESDRVETLPSSEVADLLAVLEDHLPTSMTLYTELPESVRRSFGPGSATDLLREQVEGFAEDLGAVVLLLDALRVEEERGADRDLAEHGRFLAAAREARAARVSAVEAPRGALDLTSYREERA